MSTTQRLQDVTPEDFDYLFNTNVKGAFVAIRGWQAHAGTRHPGLRRARATGGRIINIASTAGLRVAADCVYCMSKSAVVQMTKAMALEWGLWHQCECDLPRVH